MRLEKGKQYECLDWFGGLFKKGKVYQCVEDGVLLNEKDDEQNVEIAYHRFKLHEPEPKLGDKVLVWDDDESLTFELIFLAKTDGDFPYLTVTEREYIEYKAGQYCRCTAYKNMKPLPNVETVSLKEALSILEAHKGVKCRIEGCE